jgi:regulator of replication initiation timing
MKENFLQSLNSYADALEQKMDSLEKRVAELEQQLHQSVQENEHTRAKVGRLEEMLLAANQQLASLQLDTPVPQRQAAPQELELNLEPEPLQKPEPIEEPIAAPAPIAEMEPIEEPMVEAPIAEEPVMEAPAEESISEALSLEDLPTIDEMEVAEPLPMDQDGVVALDGDDMPDVVAIQPLEDLPVAEPVAEVPVVEPVVETAPVAEPAAAPVAEPVAPVTEPAAPVTEPVAAPQPAPQPAARPSMYGPQVSDIRQAISLGDRFLFQRELFGQSGEKLQKTLDTINQMGSFDEALGYLDQNFNWDKEATAYNLFITALHRRFG